LIRGAPQRRQSEGKKVANKASAIPPIEEIREATKAFCCSTTLVSAARVGCPLLLKTSLPRPGSATGAPTGRIPFSIAGSHWLRNHRKGSGSRALRGRRKLRTVFHFDKVRTIIPPVTIPTTDRFQPHQRQNPLLQKVSRTRTISLNAPAVFAMERLGQHGRQTSRFTTRE